MGEYRADAEYGGQRTLIRALIVSDSMVTGVVVASMVERAGIQAHKSHPDHALDEIGRIAPGIVILDSQDETLCQSIGRALVGSAFLVAVNAISEEPWIDAHIQRPVTVEVLQPILTRLKKQHLSRLP